MFKKEVYRTLFEIEYPLLVSPGILSNIVSKVQLENLEKFPISEESQFGFSKIYPVTPSRIFLITDNNTGFIRVYKFSKIGLCKNP